MLFLLSKQVAMVDYVIITEAMLRILQVDCS